jgi:hypothetical protein
MTDELDDKYYNESVRFNDDVSNIIAKFLIKWGILTRMNDIIQENDPQKVIEFKESLNSYLDTLTNDVEKLMKAK